MFIVIIMICLIAIEYQCQRLLSPPYKSVGLHNCALPAFTHDNTWDKKCRISQINKLNCWNPIFWCWSVLDHWMIVFVQSEEVVYFVLFRSADHSNLYNVSVITVQLCRTRTEFHQSMFYDMLFYNINQHWYDYWAGQYISCSTGYLAS